MDGDSQGSKTFSQETDSQMERKKSFIQFEIIDKKYEIEEFTNYIRRIKGYEEINLSKWSIEQIKIMVEDFRHDKDADKKNELENIAINEQIDIETNTLAYKINSTVEDKEQVDYITTIKQEKSFLSDYPNLTFQITK